MFADRAVELAIRLISFSLDSQHSSRANASARAAPYCKSRIPVARWGKNNINMSGVCPASASNIQACINVAFN